MTSYSPLFNVLANGQWVRRGMVWHWVTNANAPDVRPSYEPSDLIACPTCLARMDERCMKTDRSPRRHSHESRLVKRVCYCGSPVRPREPMCGFCRAEMAIEVAA